MTGSFDSRYKFTAKERDEETGYDYFGARYYTSDESIWLSVDPMSDKYPSLSPYMYCAGNPVRLIDPDGNASIIPPTAEEYAKFNISPETQKRFDAILHNIESFKNNETFMNAFTNTTGLTTEQATEFLTYGKGPKVDLVSGNWANSTNYIKTGSFSFGVDMINYLGSISSENIDQMGEQAFGIAMVLTDELSHCGDMKTNKSANSTGNNFNNPGKQNWKFSPTLHRGDDARFFSFGIGAMTNTEHAGDPGKVSYYIPSIKYQPSSMPIIPNPIKRENRIKIGNQLLK
ncbi:MAG: RHS repeat-associated core domain-containing protein [Ignavibacteria bacterium]|nr:RHS repeat-associated core domain-containing protein [Ignavibacteria bacterium]